MVPGTRYRARGRLHAREWTLDPFRRPARPWTPCRRAGHADGRIVAFTIPPVLPYERDTALIAALENSQVQVFKVIDGKRFKEAVKAWDGSAPFYDAGEAEREARRYRLENPDSKEAKAHRKRNAEIARREAEAARARRRKAKRKGKGA